MLDRGRRWGGFGRRKGSVTPSTLRTSVTLNDGVAASGKSYVPIRMITEHVDPGEETLGDLPGHRLIVWYNKNPESDATRIGFI